jgi:hypothetical protein
MKLSQTLSRLFLPVCLPVVALAAVALVSVVGTAAPSPVLAADAEPLNEAEILGEAYIETKFQFVKFKFDGKEWENHEYIKGAKTLVIRGIERDSDHTIEMIPRDGGYDPMTLSIKSADFKRTIVKTKGRTKTLAFRANFKADFQKTPAPAPEPAK